MRIMTEHS